jgi:hypothetical protein
MIITTMKQLTTVLSANDTEPKIPHKSLQLVNLKEGISNIQREAVPETCLTAVHKLSVLNDNSL